MQKTKIPWTDYTWNPTSGCSKGCSYCYARKMAQRFGRSFEPTCHPEKLEEPLKRQNPSRIFVDSNGDLFDPAIPDEFVDRVWAVMSCSMQHTYQILTKRPKRMLEWNMSQWNAKPTQEQLRMWTLANVWQGITAEDQPRFDERAQYLIQIPAACRFVSLEPLLGAIDFRFSLARIGWVIVGEDSTPGAKMPPDEWVEKIIDQCRENDVPMWIKGKLAERFPIQEFPR